DLAAVKETADSALQNVSHDATLTGDGTAASPLKALSGSASGPRIEYGTGTVNVTSAIGSTDVIITFKKPFPVPPTVVATMQNGDSGIEATFPAFVKSVAPARAFISFVPAKPGAYPIHWIAIGPQS
ncbi:hypothetical protein, partial [Propionibacterium freudenreichii]|uniref:hypothetical protein n=1 Tax=Propionibacterium freudenreichii TaxID=1744 RepID=UPI000A801BFF